MNLFVSLKYLVALDDHRHFGRAALACSVTQPALSNAIRALEESFGTSIVKRGRSFAGLRLDGLDLREGEESGLAKIIDAGWGNVTGRRLHLTPTGWLRLDAIATLLTSFRNH